MQKQWIKDAVLVGVLLASVGLNVAQMKQLSGLRNRVELDTRLPAGSPALPIAVRDLAGKPVRLEYAGELPTILYIFSPQCGWCDRNLPNVAALARQVSRRYRLVAVSLKEEGVVEYVRKHGWTFPVYSGISREAIAYFRLRSTPTTAVISPEGRILHSWTGAYAGSVLAEMQDALQVRLPGIRQ